jgi:hypothetical protein
VARSAPFGRIAGFLIALAASGGCDGKTIHLGDGRDGAPCAPAQVNANELLWIGDSWVLVTGTQHTRVRDLARASGAIGPNDDYVIGAMPAATMAAIADQYGAQEAGPIKVKVVIMDGGTWDTLVGGGSAASVNSAASSFAQFLAQVARDGTVAHIVYFLTPELPGIPGVAALRPLVKQSCSQSTVPCHFIDLQTFWAGHPEYTTGDLVPIPTEAGASAIADAIWAEMQARCVAQ